MSGDAETENSAGGGKGMMIGVLVATLIAVGAGAGAGFVLAPKFATKAAKAADDAASADAAEAGEKKEEKAKEEEGDTATYDNDHVVLKIHPVTTNLRHPFRSWVRLEGALVIKGEEMEEKAMEELSAMVQQDVMTYLRTLSLKDLEGASNLTFLRDDLTERARLRSNGQVAEFIILSLVVE